MLRGQLERGLMEYITGVQNEAQKARFAMLGNSSHFCDLQKLADPIPPADFEPSLFPSPSDETHRGLAMHGCLVPTQ